MPSKPRLLVLPAALLCAALLSSGCASTPEPVKAPPELPVVKVVLYQNGVGYFERRGQVKDGQVELRVRPDQINDVLKSLAVLDLSGGIPSSVSLPVERSGDSLAAELPAQVRDAAGLHSLLAVLRGAYVETEGEEDGKLAGRVVGVEMPPGSGKDAPALGAVLTLMADGGELLTTRVADIRKVTIGDRALSVGLERSLDISRADGAWKPVSLTVRLAGDGTHDLIISYIHEVPIWRPAYRAWVEKEKGVQLQGWAVVDNVSGEAWNDVALTLVVGSPLSFRYDLHTPHHVQRPDLSSRLPTVAAAPPSPDVGYQAAPPPPPPSAPADEYAAYEEERYEAAESKKVARKDSRAPSAAPRPSAAMPAPPPSRSKPGKAYDQVAEDQRRDAMMRSAQALVVGKEVGALYTYEATTPVTVPDRAAALINIVNRKVEGEDVFLFRELTPGAAPFRAVMLRNGKESTLEAGPITLFVDGTFAGEGFIGRLGKDETAFVPYAREGGFALNLASESKVDALRLLKVVDGRITIQGKRVHRRTVSLESNRDGDSVAYVKLPLTPGFELVDPPKDLVRAGAEVFLPVRVAAKAKGEARLVEATPVEFVEAGLTPNTLEAFRFYLEGAKPEDAIAGPIRELLKISEEIAALQREGSALRNQRDLLDDENGRIESNLYALPNAAVADKLRKQLTAQLEETARKSAEVAKKLVENEVKLAALNERVVVGLRQISLK